MFTEKTVFVIGAGASWHYGYPTGEPLIQKMIEIGRMLQNPWASFPNDTDLDQLSLDGFGLGWHDLRQQVLILADKLHDSNPLVIDYFLGHNNDLQGAGKFLIAVTILECQYFGDRRRININRYPEYRALEKPAEMFRGWDDWCRFIIHQLTSGCRRPEDLLKNRVNFITFNYDTSLEEQIRHRLSDMKTFSQDFIDAFINENRIVHVYGDVRNKRIPSERPWIYQDARLGWWAPEGDQEKEFLRTAMQDAIRAATGIYTIDPDEKLTNGSDIKNARELIKRANCVCFLGYGFDNNNNQRLDLADGLRGPQRATDRFRVLFTNMDDHARINRRVSQIIFNRPDMIECGQSFGPISSSAQDPSCTIEKSTRDVYGALAKDFEFPDDSRQA